MSVLIVVVILAGTIVTALLMTGRPVSSTGRIKAIGCELWADANRTTKLTLIDWGVLKPGDVAHSSFWIQNTGNINGTLSFNVSDWYFKSVDPNTTVAGNASTYFVFSWNYTGYVLKPFETIPVQMQVSVSPQIVNVDQFNCTMTIWNTE